MAVEATAVAEVGMEAINKLKSTDPPEFLTPNSDLSLTTRLASQHLFSSLKPYTPKSPFDHLLTDGFDPEQIWQQIDIQSQPLLSSLKREIKKFEKDPDRILRFFGGKEEGGSGKGGVLGNVYVGFDEISEDFDSMDEEEDVESESEGESEEGDEEEGEDEDEEVESDADGVHEVEDEFFKVKDLAKYLVREEKKEYGGEEGKSKKNKKKISKKKNDDVDEDGNESEDDDDEADDNIDETELLMYGGIGDDEDEAEDTIRFEDFYVPNKKVPIRKQRKVNESDDSEMEDVRNVPKSNLKQVEESVESEEESDDSDEESDDSEMEDADDKQNKKNLSTHERELEKMQAKIKQMEEANLAPKEWIMQGEITASKRPRDSALEVDLDFEHNVRPPPVITEEVTESLEEIIKKRIVEGQFDDVQRAPKLPSTAPKERKELDESKSKKGLAEIYEEEYAQQTGLASAPLSHNEELKKEASELFKRLCLKLDAVSHFHFAPKPVVDDMNIPTNVPALAMEEIAPVAVSDAAMLAPEEIFAGKGDVKEDAELTKEDRKRKRAKTKRKLKAINASKPVKRTADETLQNHSEGKEP